MKKILAFAFVLSLFIFYFDISRASDQTQQYDLPEQSNDQFQYTHGELTRLSRQRGFQQGYRRSDADNAFGYYARVDIRQLLLDQCLLFPEGPQWDTPCRYIHAAAQEAPGRTAFKLAPPTPNPLFHMLTIDTAFESYDLAYASSVPGVPLAYTPPDTMGAVGPEQFATIQNGLYRWHDKITGVADTSLDIAATAFWPDSVDPNDDGGGDPRVRFDRLTDTWIISAFTRTGPTGSQANNYILLAVSDGPIITTSSVWTYYYIEPLNTVGGAGDAGCFLDYPMLAVDANAILIGANMFWVGTDLECGYVPGLGLLGADTSMYVIAKDSLPPAGGNISAITTAFIENYAIPAFLGGQPVLWTPMPVDNYDPNAGVSYFVAQNGLQDDSIVVATINNSDGAPGTPSISFQEVTINPKNDGFTPNSNPPGYGVPYPGVPNPSPSVPGWGLDPMGFRPIGGAHYRDGTIWLTMTSSVTGPQGSVSLWPNRGDRHSVLVLEIDPETGATVQDTNIFDSITPVGSEPDHYWLGAVMVNGQGHALAGFSAANASNLAPSGAWSARLADDPPNYFGPPEIYWQGQNTGDVRWFFESARETRWGDYSMTTLDPCDDMTFYTIQQYQDAPVHSFEFPAGSGIIRTGGNWGTAVARVLAPAPTINSVTDATIGIGLDSISVFVEGTGFYTPPLEGMSYCRQDITASTVFPGLSIESFTYIDENNLAFVFDTTAIAPSDQTRTATITVTNPDGQTVDFLLFIEPTNLPGLGDPGFSNPGLTKVGVLAPGEIGLPGETITWTITAQNPTNSQLSNIRITDTLPAALDLIDATTTLGNLSISQQTLTVTITSLAPGEVVTITIITEIRGIPPSGEFSNTAKMTADGNFATSATAVLPGVANLPETGYPPEE